MANKHWDLPCLEPSTTISEIGSGDCRASKCLLYTEDFWTKHF